MNKHTQTPWKSSLSTVYKPHQESPAIEDGEIICATIIRENAAFIVRAVNSHEELLTFAKILLAVIKKNKNPNGDMLEHLEGVIAKAQGTL